MTDVLNRMSVSGRSSGLTPNGVAVFLLLGLTGLLPTPLLGQIVGTVHDFSAAGWNTTGEICEVCHTPHNADLSVVDAPLWNHEVTVSSFTVYSSPTLDYDPEQPRGPSRLCLSCHDGVVAVDSYGGKTGTETIGGLGLIGTNLSDDHPISLVWRHQPIEDTNQCITFHNAHGGVGYNNELPFFPGPGAVDYYMECATCHDVHSSGLPSLLRMTMTGSQMCFFCHNR